MNTRRLVAVHSCRDNTGGSQDKCGQSYLYCCSVAVFIVVRITDALIFLSILNLQFLSKILFFTNMDLECWGHPAEMGLEAAGGDMNIFFN